MAKLLNIFKFNKSKFAYLIFIMICFSGCIYHVIQVTAIFLKFQTQTDVLLDSESQIVVPMVTLCTERHKFHENGSISIPKYETPSLIYNNTYDFEHLFFMCNIRKYEDKYNFSRYNKNNLFCEDGKFKAQIEKIVNFFMVCFNIKHPQFSKNKTRARGFLYDIWLYNYHSEFKLFLTSDYNIPNIIDTIPFTLKSKSIF